MTDAPSAPIDAKSRLYLIDGSGYIFRAYHALPPLTRARDGLPVGAVSGFCNMLFKFLNEIKASERPTHLAVIFDKSEETFRKEIYPAYKAQRPSPPEDLIPQFALIREATLAFGVPSVEMDGYEADDLIATYARQAARLGARVDIISSDKDLMQLIDGDRICLFDPMKSRPLGPDAVMEKFGVPPDKVIDVQALMGDSVDNVPGAPGIGQKTAAELINAYGTLEELLARASEIKQPKRRETLIQHADQIRLSKELVTLKDDVPVEQPMESFAVRGDGDGALLKFLDEMEFRTLARRVRERGAKEAEPAAPGPAPQAESGEAAPQTFDFSAYAIVDDETALAAWTARAMAQPVVAIAAQTDAAFNLVGVSLALAPNDACYIPLAHETDPGDLFSEPSGAETGPARNAPLQSALAILKPLLESAAILKVGHDVKTAVRAFARHGVALAPYDCVMLASYVLAGGMLKDHGLEELSHRHLGHIPIGFESVAGKGKAQIPLARAAIAAAARYSAEDADIALRLWRKLKPEVARQRLLTVYETLERPLPRVLAAMEEAGVKVDTDVLSRLSGEFAQRMAALEAEARELVGRDFNIGSPAQIGDILFGEMGLPGGTKTKTGAWSTGANALEELADQGHALPRTVLDWRQLAKLRSTYTETLREAMDPDTRRVHTRFALASTTTGRLSSQDPNLQNIPVRTDVGRQLREAFIADDGMALVSADYSQIELRLLAHVADIPQLKKAFQDGIDIHALTASEMFGVPVAGMDPSVRRQAKAINFGIIYGISAFGLARNLGIERSEADAYIKTYFQRFPGIRDYMEEMKAFARANGFVRTIFGRRCWIADIKTRAPSQRAFAERQAINAPLQGAAADIIRRAMARLPEALANAGLSARMLLQVHDELLFEAPQAEVETLCALAKSVMEAAPLPAVSLSVPLTVEARAGRTWGEAH